jgi:predicted site-specific integrase-resolvase
MSKEMTVAQFAERLGLSKSSGYVIVKDGRVDTVNVGTAKRVRLRITEQAYQRYLKQQATRSPKAA